MADKKETKTVKKKDEKQMQAPPRRRSQHILVIPHNGRMISDLKGRSLVVRTTKQEDVSRIYHTAGRDNKLHCIVLDLNEPLTALHPQEDWGEIPMAIYANSMGPLRTFMGMPLRFLRSGNVRAFLTTDKKRNLRDLQIMASLGAACGVYFGQKPVDWESLNDLMTYTIYGKGRHAAIEPFSYLVTHYDPREITDFSAVYFDSPKKYLHLDKDYRIALTHKDLINGNFIAEGLEALDNIHENPKYKDYQHQWQDSLLKKEEVSFWPGWRIAVGKVSEEAQNDPSCQKFFTDLMEGAEFVQAKQTRKTEKWQP